MIEFFIPGEPPTATAQQKGYNAAAHRYYKTAELKNAEQRYFAWARRNAPAEPLTGPVVMLVEFRFVPTGRHKPGTLKDTKPDTDNMIKALKDQMTKAGFWRDDAQVAQETVVKCYASENEAPGVAVQVYSWEEVQRLGEVTESTEA